MFSKHLKKKKKTTLEYILKLLILGRGGKKGATESCGACRGTGSQVQVHQIGPGVIHQLQTVCPECKGEGERINPKDRCKGCNGKKVSRYVVD